MGLCQLRLKYTAGKKCIYLFFSSDPADGFHRFYPFVTLISRQRNEDFSINYHVKNSHLRTVHVIIERKAHVPAKWQLRTD